MSGYTPTTDEVREDFAYPWEGFEQDREGRLEAFDRWLNSERARIWDEGYRRSCMDHSTWCRKTNGDHGQQQINPYRSTP